MGPTAFSICVSSYRPRNGGNLDEKYADDFNLIIPASNSHTVQDEIDHIAAWADGNNLKLNQSKSAELIIRKPRSKIPDPPPLNNLPRVDHLKILGVTIESNLSMRSHIDNIVTRASQTMYALKTVNAQGLPLNVYSPTLPDQLYYPDSLRITCLVWPHKQ